MTAKELLTAYEDCRNELCLRCGDYTERHLGACNGCRWREPAELTECHIFDREETHPNCTVQVLTNTATGETSVGWWENE